VAIGSAIAPYASRPAVVYASLAVLIAALEHDIIDAEDFGSG
jgi:hypothetical protein